MWRPPAPTSTCLPASMNCPRCSACLAWQLRQPPLCLPSQHRRSTRRAKAHRLVLRCRRPCPQLPLAHQPRQGRPAGCVISVPAAVTSLSNGIRTTPAVLGWSQLVPAFTMSPSTSSCARKLATDLPRHRRCRQRLRRLPLRRLSSRTLRRRPTRQTCWLSSKGTHPADRRACWCPSAPPSVQRLRTTPFRRHLTGTILPSLCMLPMSAPPPAPCLRHS